MAAPRRLRPEDLEACAPILEAYPFKPDRHYLEQAGSEALTRLLQARVEGMLATGSGFWIPDEGIAAWRPLGFDSEILGFPSARVEVLMGSWATIGKLLDVVCDDCRKDEIYHLSARVDAADVGAIHALEQHSFVTMDILLTYSMPVTGVSQDGRKDNRFLIREARPADADSVAEIARSSFQQDRYHTDPAIEPEAANRVYEEWGRNAINGTAADAVLVTESEGRVDGFLAVSLDRESEPHLGFLVGNIVLTATGERARGKGIGAALVAASLEWFGDNGAAVAEVGTQVTNFAGARLYERCGFQLAASHVTLRTVLDDG